MGGGGGLDLSRRRGGGGGGRAGDRDVIQDSVRCVDHDWDD